MAFTESQGQAESHPCEHSAVNPQHRKQAQGQQVWRQASIRPASPLRHAHAGGRECARKVNRPHASQSYWANSRGLHAELYFWFGTVISRRWMLQPPLHILVWASAEALTTHFKQTRWVLMPANWAASTIAVLASMPKCRIPIIIKSRRSLLRPASSI